ncbi:hypothetical protein JWG39_11020 [Desulforhopalus vacuolatus]|uniref:hypothetical protein n=1 Tax=Desulforhopalus vacuolatus TaxID=40414 RepID=UPI0019660C71|nr:hypothetical protein [Desulforhopalus vacuolatus]MBM9520342.1 hypothetical protein [Desulforhopalus vacuolatus]
MDLKIQTKESPKTLFRKKTKIHNPVLLSARAEAWAEVAVKDVGMVLAGAKAEVAEDLVEARDSPNTLLNTVKEQFFTVKKNRGQITMSMSITVLID